jgi:superfamily I DNA/RNA helicase
MAAFTHVPSTKQVAIFDWFAHIEIGKPKHLVVRARAGTGKTSTICAALAYVPKGVSVLVCAFGKDIQLELARRLADTPAVDVRTIHSLGLATVKRFWPDVKVDFKTNDRETDLAERACGSRAPDAIKKLVAKLCTKGRLTAPHAQVADDLVNVAIEFECTPDEQWERDGFGLDYVCQKALDAMVLAASEKPVRTGIDGADMLYLPVRNGWLRKTYDVGVVDEGQDMNVCQLEIVQGLTRNNFVTVGDDRQAIYAFAGADSGSLDRLKRQMQADELPLNVTYRCGKSIVRVAQGYVPDFEAGPDNDEGEILELGVNLDGQPNGETLTGAAGPGDFILSRVNAPLVSIAMKLLRAGKRTKIAGRDIGDGLVSLVRKLRGRSVPDFLAKVASWEAREVARLQPALAKATNGRKRTIEQKIEGIHDKAEMLISLADGAPSVDEIESRISALFTDDGLGDKGLIVCSSVHKAKGKEADRVFILRDTLRSGGEEDNIAYVAVTRAKKTLVWVSDQNKTIQ